jgi:peptidoglycan/LPS O-acetylase OafA/YrhL
MGQNWFLFYQKVTNGSRFWNFISVTWTLGVEEQFYLIMPIFASCLMKIKSKTNGILMLIILTVIFYKVASYLTQAYREGSVFMLPIHRFWEFLIGCTLSYYEINNRKDNQTNLKRKSLLDR